MKPRIDELSSQYNDDERRQMLETMLTIRAYEEMVTSFATPLRPGTCTSVGQEACAVGVVKALDAKDRILTNHRSAGHLIARGAELPRMVAEVLGRADGYCKGRSGSLHISASDIGVVLTSTIVGAGLTLAPGVALAQKMKCGTSDGITVVFFGDGAACQGVFHEAVNLAVKWELPILFVCENNQWQAFVRRDETMPVTNVIDWVSGHQIASSRIDGNDLDGVAEESRWAVDYVRTTSKPYFLELTTYRLRGHFEPDDQAYVDQDELQRNRQRDPIKLYTEKLLRDGALRPEQLSQMQARVGRNIEDAKAFALASPWPEVTTAFDDVYA